MESCRRNVVTSMGGVLGENQPKRALQSSLRNVGSIKETFGRIFDLCIRKIYEAAEGRWS